VFELKMTFKEKLKSKLPIFGTWLTLPSATIAEIVCNAGVQFVAIDLEHSCLTLDQCQELIRTVELSGANPFVRLSSNDEVQIKRVMDAGAHGIIVPMVNCLKDVEKAFKAIHYPPQGTRGVGLSRAQKYGADFKGYWQWQSTEATLIVQIEHKNALENLDQIFASGLIDGYLIGPYDLSASLGVPGDIENDEVQRALRHIEEKAHQYNVNMGVHIVEMDNKALERSIKAGYKIIAYGVDFRTIEKSYSDAAKQFKILSET
jgi:2-dehydro-3-deoxyglucarate aldolase